MHVSIAEIADAFPDYRVAFVVAEGLTIAPERPPALDALIARARGRGARAMGHDRAVADPRHRGLARRLQGLRHQADALSLLGRAAGEERARRPAARARQCVRRSLQRGVARACAAARRGRSRPGRRRRSPSATRARATASSTWREEGEAPEAPKPGEVVYADAAHVLCRRWNWRQDARTLITPATRRAVVTVQSNGAGDVAAGSRRSHGTRLPSSAAGNCRVVVLNAAHPKSDL